MKFIAQPRREFIRGKIVTRWIHYDGTAFGLWNVPNPYVVIVTNHELFKRESDIVTSIRMGDMNVVDTL